jgi:hypothetical protein
MRIKPVLRVEQSASRKRQDGGISAVSSFLFASTIFLSALLLFDIEPLIGRYVLPWFGGGPAIWTTCLLFFQFTLLAGYAYAHWTTARLPIRAQAAVHLLLLIAAILFLPTIPADRWKPADPGFPTWRILLLLLATIGLPFFVLCSTAPLLQAWLVRVRVGQIPYRLYALSNAGSLLALLSYPFVVEPLLGRRLQAICWGYGFVTFGVLCGFCALLLVRCANHVASPHANDTQPNAIAPSRLDRFTVLILPAIASVLLVGTTNTLTQDVAPVPLLWVLPLAVYLVSFILCFEHSRWYRRDLFGGLLIPCVGIYFWLMTLPAGKTPLKLQIAFHCVLLFVACMICHGEVARLRPHARHLTGYYLAIAAGGALGGVFVALIAPRIFFDFAELRWGVFACCAFFLILLAVDPQSKLYRLRPSWAWFLVIIAMTLIGVLTFAGPTTLTNARILTRVRNFYGVMTVAQRGDAGSSYRLLQHGRIIHGLQFMDPARAKSPFSYYGPQSGLAKTIGAMHAHRRAMRIGVIGLGAGSIAAFGRSGDELRFYEIDPGVERLARSYFTYLRDTPAKTSVILGDARLSLERTQDIFGDVALSPPPVLRGRVREGVRASGVSSTQPPPRPSPGVPEEGEKMPPDVPHIPLKREPSENFDLLVLDAFSGDSIPIHLLTAEAFDQYLRHLRSDGLIAMQITNRYLDLQPAVARIATHLGLRGIVIASDLPKSPTATEFSSIWVILAQEQTVAELIDLREAGKPLPTMNDAGMWTDGHSSLFAAMRLR